MKLIFCLTLSLSCVSAFQNSDDFINEINSKQNLWKAGRNFHKDISEDEIKALLGAKELSQEEHKYIPIIRHQTDESVEIPDSFDGRIQWPNCKTVQEIADQSACGSCWAVSTASAIQDRICIHSNGKLQPEISAKNLMACETQSNGCQGGYPIYAWNYWTTDGVVTGGSYGSNIGCQPYPFPMCEHNVKGKKPSCSGKYETPQCVKACDNGTINFSGDLIYGALKYFVEANETQIQVEIMKNGPVVAVFKVFEDFINYKSGVYFRGTNFSIGQHAVRIIGWGLERGVKYWLIANSWNEDWGDKGWVKIRRGHNECGIESKVSAGIPKIQ